LNNSISNTHPIVEEALNNFFDKPDKKDFLSKISEELKALRPSKENNLREQIGFEISTSAETRFQLDQLITFAEIKLTEEKFIEFLIYLGQHTIIAGENSIALEIHEKILRICNDKPEMTNIFANALLSIGEVYSRQAQWELSINYLDRSVKIFRDESDTRGNIHCQNILGTIYGDQGNLDKAKEHFENALAALQEIKDTILIGKIEINLGIINNMQGNYNEALSYFKRALLNFEKVSDVRRIAEIRQNLGTVYMKKKEYSAAINEFNESIELSLSSNYMQNLGITYLNKALVYILQADSKYSYPIIRS